MSIKAQTLSSPATEPAAPGWGCEFASVADSQVFTLLGLEELMEGFTLQPPHLTPNSQDTTYRKGKLHPRVSCLTPAWLVTSKHSKK